MQDGTVLARDGRRLAYGELQHLIWQAQTFGFHLAELEIRQHASVHARAVDELAPEATAGMATVAAVNFGAPDVSFLWHNVIGAVTVVVVGVGLSSLSRG